MKAIWFLWVAALSMIFFFSCNKNNPSESGPSSFSILVENAQGQSLLDPATPGHFAIADIKRADLVNDNELIFNQGMLDNSKGFSIVNEGGKSFLLFSPGLSNQQSETTTYFYWDANTKDTVVCRFGSNGQSDRVVDVWLKNVKVFPDKNVAGYPGQGAFRIIK